MPSFDPPRAIPLPPPGQAAAPTTAAQRLLMAGMSLVLVAIIGFYLSWELLLSMNRHCGDECDRGREWTYLLIGASVATGMLSVAFIGSYAAHRWRRLRYGRRTAPALGAIQAAVLAGRQDSALITVRDRLRLAAAGAFELEQRRALGQAWLNAGFLLAFGSAVVAGRMVIQLGVSGSVDWLYAAVLVLGAALSAFCIRRGTQRLRNTYGEIDQWLDQAEVDAGATLRGPGISARRA